MLRPGKNKVLVNIYNLTNPYIYLPEDYKKPKLSVAEIIDGNGEFKRGSKVLVPTLAGLSVTVMDTEKNKDRLRLVNSSDILAYISESALDFE